MRSSKGVSEPFAASTVIAPTATAASNRRRTRCTAKIANAVDAWVPLSSANPSFGPSTSGATPARASPCNAGTRTPSTQASPTPISTALRCASGARSPDAPTEPFSGTTGSTSASSKASKASMTVRRTPDTPCARLAAFSNNISRTTGAASGWPTPAQCDSTRFDCKRARSASAMRVCASLPKPVLMP